MDNFFIKKMRNEDGAVLITSLLFLMIVTVLALIGIQSPKTDIMISGNEKLSVQAQQLSNMGIMEAKNWLALHYKPNAVPLNAIGKDSAGDLKYFIVARPSKMAKDEDGNDDLENDIDTNFSRAGVLSTTKLTVTEPIASDTFNTGTEITRDVFKDATPIESDFTLKDDNDNEIATYEWNIVRLSSAIFVAGSVNEISDDELDNYTSGLSSSIAGKFDKSTPITTAESVAIGDGGAFWLYFHISSEATSNGLIAQSEGIASYKQIVPAQD